MDKTLLRNHMINRLKTIPSEEHNQIESKLFYYLFRTSFWKNAKTIGTTWPKSFEWDTTKLMETAWLNHKTICIPKSNFKTKQMEFYQIKSKKDIQVGYANIMEPKIGTTKKVDRAEIELLIVPGIIFDPFGYRIGFGGGFYDRYLKNFMNNTVSLASLKQIIPLIASEPHDVPVQYLITEKGCMVTKNNHF